MFTGGNCGGFASTDRLELHHMLWLWRCGFLHGSGDEHGHSVSAGGHRCGSGWDPWVCSLFVEKIPNAGPFGRFRFRHDGISIFAPLLCISWKPLADVASDALQSCFRSGASSHLILAKRDGIGRPPSSGGWILQILIAEVKP